MEMITHKRKALKAAEKIDFFFHFQITKNKMKCKVVGFFLTGCCRTIGIAWFPQICIL